MALGALGALGATGAFIATVGIYNKENLKKFSEKIMNKKIIKNKYLKYKIKYINLKNNLIGND